MTKKSKKRDAKVMAMDVHYMKAGYFKSDCCVYCGDVATDLDHVTPISLAYALGVSVLEKEFGAEFLKVPSCSECNSKVLGAVNVCTVKERKEIVLKYLEKEFIKYNTPKWTNDELGELGFTLASKIVPLQDYKEALTRRINWASSAVNIAWDNSKMGLIE